MEIFALYISSKPSWWEILKDAYNQSIFKTQKMRVSVKICQFRLRLRSNADSGSGYVYNLLLILHSAPTKKKDGSLFRNPAKNPFYIYFFLFFFLVKIEKMRKTNTKKKHLKSFLHLFLLSNNVGNNN